MSEHLAQKIGKRHQMRKQPPADQDLITQVEPNLYFVDSRRIGAFNGSGIYIIKGDGLTLIETGTSIVARRILESIREIGCREKEINRVIVTHIHLDHSGAAGWLVRRLPNLQVYVHERGARHLLDPSKLIRSAETVYGNLENLLALHGEILPVPEKNLVPVSDTEIDMGGGASLTSFSAPGHAPHHLCLFDPESRCLFSGEALGHYYPESDMITPAIAPPGFDFEASKKTILAIKRLKPRAIFFSHNGPHRNSAFVIKEAIHQLDFYAEHITALLKQGLSSNEIIAAILKNLGDGQFGNADNARVMITSMVFGFETYYRRKVKS